MKKNKIINVKPVEVETKQKTIENVELVIYLILFGKSDFEIARQIDITLSALHRLKNSDLFLELYNRILTNIEENVKGKLVSIYSSALSKLQELINSGNENIAMEAATKILKIRLGNFESNSNVQINVGEKSTEEDKDSNLIADIILRRKERKIE